MGNFITKFLGLTKAAVLPPAKQFNQIVYQSIGVSALWNTDHFGVSSYSNNATVYSIVNRIAKTAAIAPFKVYRVKDAKKHLKYKAWTGENATQASLMKALQMKALVYEEDNAHPLNALIDRPNKWQKGTEFTINSIGFKLLSGNRFIYLNLLDGGADRGKPYDIWNLPPQFMKIIPDGTPYGVEGYRFELNREGDRIPKENIIHSKYFNPDFTSDGAHLWGMSPIRAAARNIDRNNAGSARSTAMLQNAGAAGVLVSEENEYSKEQVEEAKSDINNNLLGTRNTAKIALLNGKWQYIDFAMTAADMQVIESEKYSVQQLCNIYGVPPGLFDPDKSGEHNASEFKKELIGSAVIPVLSELRDDWNYIASFYKEDIYVDFDISVYPELQEDMDKVAARLEKMWYLTPNQKRLIVGEDEDGAEPLMNTYFVPSGLTPIGDLGNNDQMLLDGLDENI